MNALFIIVLATQIGYLDLLPDDPPVGVLPDFAESRRAGHYEIRKPQLVFTQVMHLRAGWNLVSRYGTPKTKGFGDMLTLREILPANEPWLFERKVRLYNYASNAYWYPQCEFLKNDCWDFESAYYLYLTDPYEWRLDSCTAYQSQWFEFTPRSAWDRANCRGNRSLNWHMLGYPLAVTMRLASLPKVAQVSSGNPKFFESIEALHWLIWQEDADSNFPPGDLKIVKTDDGRCYIPTPQNVRNTVDQIGVLEPGEGYLLGFISEPEKCYRLEGWQSFARIPPAPPSPPLHSQHFRFLEYTQWWYPILIEAVDLELVPLEFGDEIGVFCGDLCVGAAIWTGKLPLVIAAWEDDIGTTLSIDGYLPGYPIRFMWYDVSKELHLHCLRHTTASDLVRAGVHLSKIQKYLGHSSVKVTEIYTHVLPEDLREVAESLICVG